jgi:FAD/FMN-containing dehydrogenase
MSREKKRIIYLVIFLVLLLFCQKQIHQVFEVLKPLYYTLRYGKNWKTDGSGVGINVPEIVYPRTIHELSNEIAKGDRKITLGGAMYSSGGQTLSSNATLFDMKKMNKILVFSEKNLLVKVESGATWGELVSFLDKKDLSVTVMQSYRNFTIGGSISVNAHGRCIRKGPIVESVVELELVLADGKVLTASRSENKDLFLSVIGGYGSIAAIANATLRVKNNRSIELVPEKVLPVKDYLSSYHSDLVKNEQVLLNNADLYPPEYDTVRVKTWILTEKERTCKDRLRKESYPNVIMQQMYYWVSDSPVGSWVRQEFEGLVRCSRGEQSMLGFAELPRKPPFGSATAEQSSARSAQPVSNYNFESSEDLSSLLPLRYFSHRYVLQEYFVPINKGARFAEHLKRILCKNNVKVLNVSIRHIAADKETIMSWAPQDSFCFVLYYRQPNAEEAKIWTRELTTEALQCNGSYYLPYQNFATQEQFEQAYPRAKEFRRIKRKYDPQGKFTSTFTESYNLQGHFFKK